jgi:hypothetical protein
MRNIHSLSREPTIKRDGVLWGTLDLLADHQAHFLTIEQITDKLMDKKGAVASRMTDAFRDGWVIREKVKNNDQFPGKTSDKFPKVNGYKISQKGLIAIGLVKPEPEPEVYTNIMDKYQDKREKEERKEERIQVLEKQEAIETLTAKSEKEILPETPLIVPETEEVYVPSPEMPEQPNNRQIEFDKMIKFLKENGIDAFEVSFKAVEESYKGTIIKNKAEQVAQKERELQELQAELDQLNEGKT